jgi:DnaJ-class molecular chaperone
LEPIPVDLPPNREHCISCKGYGGHLKINNIIFAGIQNEIWMICLECRGTGLKPQHSPGNKRFFKI